MATAPYLLAAGAAANLSRAAAVACSKPCPKHPASPSGQSPPGSVVLDGATAPAATARS